MTVAEKISLCHIGLPERDLTFIRNLFKLNVQQLHNFQFLETSPYSADVLLINGDNPAYLKRWQKIKRERPHVGGIVLSATSMVVESAINLERPLVLKKLIVALQETIANSPKFAENAINILVVNEEDSLRHYLNLKLPQLFDAPTIIDEATSFDDALLKVSSRQYDIVVLDEVMSDEDGYHLCRQLKSLQNSHVVMLTNGISPFDRIKGSVSGCNAYVTKPPTEERLRGAVHKLTEQLRKTG